MTQGPHPSIALPDPPLATVERPRQGVAMLTAAVVFAGLSVVAAVTSEGFLEADGCTHFLFARFALREWHYLVNVWGRPVCTAIYAIPAALGSSRTGLIAVRFTSLLLCLAIAAVTYRVAKRQGYRWPALAFIFTLGQPLLFLHSFSELTEVPFALLVALGLWAYQGRQWLALSAIAGLMPLSRPEGFGFLVLMAAALVLHRKWTWLLLLPVPLLLWNHAGWVLYGREGPWWRWLPDNWPYAATSLYQRGYLLHFIVLLPMVVSPLVFPAMWIGIWRSIADSRWPIASSDSRIPDVKRKVAKISHRDRVQVLIALIPLMVLLGHSVLYWLGKMASNGELRYMLVVSPFWALLSSRGWEWVFERLAWRQPLAWAGVAALVPLLSHLAYPVVPLVNQPDWHEAQRIAEWYRNSPLKEHYPRVAASHPGVWYFLDRSFSGPGAREWHKRTIASAPKGTLLIWDPVYGVYNSDRNRSITMDELRQAGWVWHRGALVGALGTEGLFASPFDPRGWQILVSPETSEGKSVPVELWSGPQGQDDTIRRSGTTRPSDDPSYFRLAPPTWRVANEVSDGDLPNLGGGPGPSPPPRQ